MTKFAILPEMIKARKLIYNEDIGILKSIY